MIELKYKCKKQNDKKMMKSSIWLISSSTSALGCNHCLHLSRHSSNEFLQVLHGNFIPYRSNDANHVLLVLWTIVLM